MPSNFGCAAGLRCFFDSAPIARQPAAMCNLYRMTRAADEVARLFGVEAPSGSNAGEDVYPGYPGLVIADGRLRTMTWGFPLSLKGKQGQPLKPKPVNNTRCDKLNNGFWKSSFVSRRCLIPVSAFAEAEGAKGAKTRTWIAVANEPVFTIAGIWRDSAEWGPVYSMLMTGACDAIRQVHDRSPVILKPEEREKWQTASTDEARKLCQPFAGSLSIDRTPEPWVRR